MFQDLVKDPIMISLDTQLTFSALFPSTWNQGENTFLISLRKRKELKKKQCQLFYELIAICVNSKRDVKQFMLFYAR